MHVCLHTKCVDAVQELSEDVLLLQEVDGDLRQRGAVLSSRLRGPAQFPDLWKNRDFKWTIYDMNSNLRHSIIYQLTSGGTRV